MCEVVDLEYLNEEKKMSIKLAEENEIKSTDSSGVETGNLFTDYSFLCPHSFEDFIGQNEAITCLKTFCKASKERNEPLDHVLLYGRPGLGKTTLAGVIANELHTNMRITSGPALEKAGDLVALLTNLSEGDILFIDDIHRLNRHFFEILFPVLDDFCIDIILGKGPSAASIHLDLPRFTLICATYRADSLNSAFRSRFGIQMKLRPYSETELRDLVGQSANKLNLQIDEESIMIIAAAGNGTPRETQRILKRVTDFAQVYQNGVITSDLTRIAINFLEATGLKKTNEAEGHITGD